MTTEQLRVINEEVATIILNQMGGMNRIKVMTGANNFIAIDYGVKFSFKGSKKMNMVEIKLNGKDLYDVKFFKYIASSMKLTEIKEMNDLYNDMLKDAFEQATGLYLSL